MSTDALITLSDKEIEIAIGREITHDERVMLHIGIDPGKSGAIATIHLFDNTLVFVQKLGEDICGWPARVSYSYKKPATCLVEAPQLSRGKASFNAGVIYGLCMYAASSMAYSPSPIMVHPNAIKKCVSTMLSNLKLGGVEIIYPEDDESYGNKHDRIVLAATMCGTTNPFRKSTGKIDDNMTDAICHALVSLYMHGGSDE